MLLVFKMPRGLGVPWHRETLLCPSTHSISSPNHFSFKLLFLVHPQLFSEPLELSCLQ